MPTETHDTPAARPDPLSERYNLVHVHIERLLEDTLSPRRRTCRPSLAAELARLERMVELAGDAYVSWRAAMQPRQSELALWLFGVAIGVAANGLRQEALALLDVLPGVPAGGEGRRALLGELLAAQDALGDLAQAS